MSLFRNRAIAPGHDRIITGSTWTPLNCGAFLGVKMLVMCPSSPSPPAVTAPFFHS